MYFRQVFEEKLAQYAYIIGCQETGEAIVVDPMRDIDRYENIAKGEGLTIVAAADTHIHADYLTGLREFAEKGVRVYASDEGGADWKYEWLIGSGYDYVLLTNGDIIEVGNIRLQAWHTPGHTPEHLSFRITDGAAADAPMGLLSGDFVFVGDVGRPDLLESAAGQQGVMESSARTLFKSISEFKSLPGYLQVWPGHGAGSACGKAMSAVPESTVGYELRFNPSILAASGEQNFVDFILEGQPEPPLYFARMKRENKYGPALLKGLPNPVTMDIDEFIKKGGSGKAVIIDTRERPVFMAGHIPGSLLALFNRQFNTTAGSYVREDEDIYLVIAEAQAEQAVRDLVRVGLDGIRGYITPADLEAYAKGGGTLERIDTIDMARTAELVQSDDYQVLDVRKASEYKEGHIPGAINIAHTRLPARESELPKGKTLLVHCQSGVRSAVASALLRRDGFDVKYIDDHIDNWPEKERG